MRQCIHWGRVFPRKGKRRFIIRNWLTWLWRLRNPTICHLQVGDSGKLVMGFSPCLNTENHGKWGYKFQLRAGDFEIDVSGQPVRHIKGTDSSFLCLLFYSVPQRIQWYQPTLRKIIHFTKSSNSNANLIWKYPTDSPRNNF